jgi:hypothetical protein
LNQTSIREAWAKVDITEYLPSKHGTLSSNLRVTKKKKEKKKKDNLGWWSGSNSKIACLTSESLSSNPSATKKKYSTQERAGGRMPA